MDPKTMSKEQLEKLVAKAKKLDEQNKKRQDYNTRRRVRMEMVYARVLKDRPDLIPSEAEVDQEIKSRK